MMEPRRAIVRPRVLSPDSGEALLLEDEILRLLDAGAAGVVVLVGPVGSGKATAMEHLAAVLPPGWDRKGLVVQAKTGGTSEPDSRVSKLEFPPRRYRLAGWQRDDLIEYLLAAHRRQCASVMARIHPLDFSLLGSLPELWRIVLDELVADPALPDARRALHRHLEGLLSDTDLLERTRSACLNAELASKPDPMDTVLGLARPGFEKRLVRLLQQPAVRCLLAAERIAADLHSEAACDFLAHRLPRPLVEATAILARGSKRAQEHVERLLSGPPWSHAMSVSLLVALDPSWKPPLVPTLEGAYLDGARWSGVNLTFTDLIDASLQGADLREANLTSARLIRANLRQAHLEGATLVHVRASEADFRGANLASVDALKANLYQAQLEGSDWTAAFLHEVNFTEANLKGAVFACSSLHQACFVDACLDGADFSGADLAGASLIKQCLRRARWEGARFQKADLRHADLEGLCLPGACFAGAQMQGALLTGTVMPGANFQAARLTGAGLADIDWEGADLRCADLRHVSFHLGTTRCGLVDSPLACEGSRTGFYTDDYNEQTYKSPEEIRKANLRGADLRGARLKWTDFYLVDLRGARLDPEVVPMLRSSGAILDPPGCCS
jgi:uncharacterized protein YjbI with pentapeptide repeats